MLQSTKIRKIAAQMFRAAAYVFKDGELVVRDGHITHCRFGRALTVKPERDRAIERRMRTYYEERYGLALGSSSKSRNKRLGGRNRSNLCHACPDGERRADRRYVRGSLWHARDRADDHCRYGALGTASGRHHDRLCDLGDRLRM